MERTQPDPQLRKYFSRLPVKSRAELRKVRLLIKSAAPRATEAFAYGIPAFRLDGRPLVYYAAWKTHTSLYPITGGIKRKYAIEMKRYETSKGTVRFPLSDPLPATFIKRLVRARVAEVRALLKDS